MRCHRNRRISRPELFRGAIIRTACGRIRPGGSAGARRRLAGAVAPPARGSRSRHWLRRRPPRRSPLARPASSFSFPCAARRHRSRKAPSATRSRQATGRLSISTWSTSTSRTHRSFATPRARRSPAREVPGPTLRRRGDAAPRGASVPRFRTGRPSFRALPWSSSTSPEHGRGDGLPPDATGAFVVIEGQRTVSVALDLHPGARRVVLVSGSSPARPGRRGVYA